jgi:hypothetical protein
LHSAYELARRELELLLVLERDPPAYLTGVLGAAPGAGEGLLAWREGARLVERYRAEHDIQDPAAPLGPRPADAVAGRLWLGTLKQVEDLRVEMHRRAAIRERNAPSEFPRIGLEAPWRAAAGVDQQAARESSVLCQALPARSSRSARETSRMVQFTLATPLGIPVYERDSEQAHHYLERVGALAAVNRAAMQQVVDTLERDWVLQRASGRWTPGRPDPDQFVPGDFAALRAILADPIFRDVRAVSLQRERTVYLRANQAGGLDLVGDRKRLLVQFDLNQLLDQPILTSQLVDLQQAVPYFIQTDAAAAVLASRPPSQGLLEELRLPFERTAVLFGADLELDPGSFPWPEQFPYQQLSRFGVVGELLARGGYLTGLVLLADDQGHLRDDVIWMVAANPDPQLPWPASLDRIRGLVRGYRSAATLAPLVTNVAAAVTWALWRDPPPAPDLPGDFTSRQFRKAFKRNSVRVRERQGGLVGIRVLDLTRNPTHAGQTGPEVSRSRRASPVPHMRAGHFRRVRVGPRADFHYEPRWIAPTWVRGDLDSADQRLVVRRVPSPTTWSRQPLRGEERPSDPEHPGPGDAATPQRPVELGPAPSRHLAIPARSDEDPFAPDLG